MSRKLIVSAVGFAVVFLSSVALVSGQGRPANISGVEQEIEPIRCWLRSDRTSIRISEKFNLTLTCRVAETDSARVELEENMLEPSAVSFPPFEIVGGERFDDLIEDPFRFLQYQYQAKLIADDLFGKEVPIPPLEIRYKIKRRVNDSENVDSRERLYVLPALPIRIQSLVPKDSKDIRDADEINFGTVKTKTFRAYAAFVAAGLLMLLVLVLALVPFIKSVRQFTIRKSNGTVFSNSALLREIKKELKRVEEMSVNGWNDELVARVVSVLRIAGAIIVDRPINQLSEIFESRGLEGQLKLHKGFVRRRKILISSDATLEMLNSYLGARKDNDPWIEKIISILSVFNRIRYSIPESDGDKNSESAIARDKELSLLLQEARVLVGRLRLRLSWPVRKFRSLTDRLKGRRLRWRSS